MEFVRSYDNVALGAGVDQVTKLCLPTVCDRLLYSAEPFVKLNQLPSSCIHDYSCSPFVEFAMQNRISFNSYLQ